MSNNLLLIGKQLAHNKFLLFLFRRLVIIDASIKINFTFVLKEHLITKARASPHARIFLLPSHLLGWLFGLVLIENVVSVQKVCALFLNQTWHRMVVSYS
jgi:hypothetical protein